MGLYSGQSLDPCAGLISVHGLAVALYEYACHEGNYGMFDLLAAARAEEKAAAAKRK